MDCVKANLEYLDAIDFSYYLKHNNTIADLIFEVEGDYEHKIKDHPVLQGKVFNWLSEDDVVVYLKERYQINIDKVIVTHYYIRGY